MARQFYKKSVRAASLKRSFYNQALVTEELVDAYQLPAKTPHAADALARMMTNAGAGPYEGLTDKISTPSLLVWGDDDTSSPPRDAERLKKELKRSRLINIKECGHYIQEEKPEELAQAIKDFLE